MPSVRNVVRTVVAALVVQIAALVVDDLAIANALARREGNVAKVSGAIGNGTTAGKLRTNAAITFAIKGSLYTKASTDDLWDLSAEAALAALQYKAYWLYLDSAGTATIAAGTVAASAAAAVAALPAITATKSVIGVYVAGPSTDFTSALVVQGTVHNGHPADHTVVQTAAAITLVAP